MKKMYTLRFVFSFISFMLIGIFSNAQITYYWVGGASGDWTAATSWNTNLNGTGTDRSAANTLDVMVFDGSNIGGTVPATGTVTPDITGSFTIGQLRLVNGANVVLQRNGSGTTSFTMGGDLSPAHDLMISNGCSLTITTSAGSGLNMLMGDAGVSDATASIYGTLSIIDNGSGTARLTALAPMSVFFQAGSVFNSNLTQASSYPFGSGSTTPSAAVHGVVFESGSVCKFLGGNSVHANTSGFYPVKWNKGSTLEMNATQPSGLFGSKYLANVKINPGVNITLTDNTFGMDTLTISSGASFNYRTSGTIPIKGDIINNGTFGAAPGFTSSNLVLIGKVPQSLTGSGTYNNIGTLSIGTDATVTLNTNIAMSGTSTSSVQGHLNTQTYTVGGTYNFQFRSANTAASSVTLVEGSNTMVFNGASAYSAGNVAIGARITGAGIAPDTYVISTSSGSFSCNISNPAMASFPGFTAAITSTNEAATLETANPGGTDGTIIIGGTRTFSTGTHYIFNAPTLAPFSTSTNNNAGDVTFNASATLNKTSQGINGVLTLGNGILTIPALDTLEINNGIAIGGAPFSGTKYIHTQTSGANTGVLRINNIAPGAMLFPVGNALYYLPATLTPTSLSDHTVSVFSGITEDGTPTGTAFTPLKKESVVDAAWIINRPNGTGDCGMTLGWNSTLEGTAFASYANNEIGIARHDGATWSITSGTGDNSANTSTSSFSSFSPFGVGKLGIILPIVFKSTNAITKGNGVEVSWDVANEESSFRYEVERSVDQLSFTKVGTVLSNNAGLYNYLDNSPQDFVTYYRVKNIDKKGDAVYSKIVSVRSASSPDISLYPNPVVDEITLSGLSTGTVVRLVDLSGSVRRQQTANAPIMKMNVSGFSLGIYIVEITGQDGTRQTKRFLKQ